MRLAGIVDEAEDRAPALMPFGQQLVIPMPEDRPHGDYLSSGAVGAGGEWDRPEETVADEMMRFPYFREPHATFLPEAEAAHPEMRQRIHRL